MEQAMSRWLTFVLVAAAMAGAGCGPTQTVPATTTVRKPKNASAPKKLEVQPVEVKVDEFVSVEAALAELDRVQELSSAEERNRGEIRVQKWLAMQQERAAPLVIAWASDPQQSIARRVAACRILGKLGPSGTDT
jgi:hypothetical protein